MENLRLPVIADPGIYGRKTIAQTKGAGNNCCNGGYGTLPDGSVCDECPAAYAMQAQGPAAMAVPAIDG